MLKQQMHPSTPQRIVVEFIAGEGVKPVEFKQRLTRAVRDRTLSRTRVFAWHEEFEGEHERVENEKHRRPCNNTKQNIRTNCVLEMDHVSKFSEVQYKLK